MSVLCTQEQLKGSVCSSMRAVLRSFTDVCDAVHVLEICLRFLGKTGGSPNVTLLSYLEESLRMKQHISSTIAKVKLTITDFILRVLIFVISVV